MRTQSIAGIFNKMDLPTFLIMVALLAIGATMLLSTSSVVGFDNFNDSYFYIKKHGVFLILGTAAFIVGLITPYQRYRDWALPGMGLAIILLVLTLIPGIGVKVAGAQRWLNIGLFRFQPVEMVKFFMIIYLAASLQNKRNVLNDYKKSLVPILSVVAIPLLCLVRQPDLGNTILILGTLFLLLFLAGIPFRYIAALISLGLTTVTLTILSHSYQMDRIKSFLFPWEDPLGRNYHIVQSFIAIGSGGIWGLGLGQSKLKYSYLPLQYSDFIFSIISEEGGFVLATVVILLFLSLLIRGVKIAMMQGTIFARFLAFGLTFFLAFQALINIAVVIGVLPVTGIPLTFISFGGTSLIMSMFSVGVLMNISSQKEEETRAANP